MLTACGRNFIRSVDRRCVLAVGGQTERNHIREKAFEGQAIAASKGTHGGRPKVIDNDMLAFAVALKDKGAPVPDVPRRPPAA